MPAIPLPVLASTNLAHSANDNAKSAYNLVLAAERAAKSEMHEDNVLRARVVGYLLLALYDFRATLGTVAVDRVSLEVCSPPSRRNMTNEEKIYALGKVYCSNLIRAFKKSKRPLPPESEHPSRSSFSTLADMIKDSMEGSGKDCRTAQRRASARDGFRCLISGYFDTVSLRKCSDLAAERRRLRVPQLELRYCYIISESTLQDIDPDISDHSGKRGYASMVMSVLHNLGLGNIISETIALHEIHHLSNVMTLSLVVRDCFDNLELWLECTDELNEYEVHVAKGMIEEDHGVSDYLPKDRIVRFEVYPEGVDPESLPLPDPRLLAIHAACARVCQMSGAAEYIDKWDRDVEDMETLSTDGSSAFILAERLDNFAIIAF